MQDMDAEATRAAEQSFNIIPNVGEDIIRVKTGDVYEFIYPMRTRGGHRFEIGDKIEVLGKTTTPAWGEVSESGFNWYCKTRHGKSIWTTLELCISRGQLGKVENDGQASRDALLAT